MISLLPLLAKAAVLGGVNSPGHVVNAPMVSLALVGLLLGLTILGRGLLPGLFLLLFALVGRIFLVLDSGVASLFLSFLLTLLSFFFLASSGASLSLPLSLAMRATSLSSSGDLAPHTLGTLRKANLADA